ncbi:hypothetical protein [Halomarina pelagica]|uniref:hypothetical protein n=1 Tax=Halomarina pelagica TaxID=2961599 RepID=UPI0020C57209|nr:hypothetical protein [Halomarina sp. BND7]
MAPFTCRYVYLELQELSAHLLEIADEEPVGPGTTRLAMAATAMYMADQLTEGNALTQTQVVGAASTMVKMTTSRLSMYFQELHDVYVTRYRSDVLDAVLKWSRSRLR